MGILVMNRETKEILSCSGIWPDRKEKGGYFIRDLNNSSIGYSREYPFEVVGDVPGKDPGYSLRLRKEYINLRRSIEDRLRKDEKFLARVAALL